MAIPLWKDFTYQEHQQSGIQWMCEREDDEEGSGGILCDEMGLGKTIEVLGVMKMHPRKHTLLLAPLATLSQWEEKALQAGFCVKRAAKSYCGWETVGGFKKEDAGRDCLYLSNYEKLISRPTLLFPKELENGVWGRAVFDEAHRLRNKNKGWEMCAKVHALSRWFLTATPIVNGIDDARHLFMLLKMKKIPGWGLSSLAPLIRNKVLARKMDDIREGRTDLPNAPIIKKHSLDFATDDEAEFYRGIQGSIARQWRALEEDGELKMQHLFKLIIRLRQISIHPQVYIAARKKFFKNYSRADWTDDSTKFIFLKKLITKEEEKSHRWLVFCHFHAEMELLQESLQQIKSIKRVSIYSGDVAESLRTIIVEKSKEPLLVGEQEVMLVQLQAGGVGLNLQHFDRIAFMGPWWTAALMDQAIGRAVRIGQTEQVYVHHIILKEEELDSLNVDRFMLEKADKKRDLCNEFLLATHAATVVDEYEDVAVSTDPVNEDPC